MTSYPPSLSLNHHHAEEYELSPATSMRGLPASSGSGGPRRSMTRQRKLTLHPNSSSALLFAAPGAAQPRRPSNRRVTSNPGFGDDPALGHSRQSFLNDDLDALGNRTEEVNLPDFGHILGFNEGDDPYTIAANMRSNWKRKLYLLMEEPSSGREAFFIHIAVTSAILFSVVLTTLSTLPSFHIDTAAVRALFGLDTTLVVLFTIEYLARSMAHSDSWSQYYNWATSFFGVLDLISILPYYIEVIRQQDTSILFRFSILRTFRLLRVFRAFKYENKMLLTIEVMYVAVRRSKDALIAISYFILLVLVLFSTLIYFAERGTWDNTLQAFVDPDGEVSLFDSIPQTAWYALVTMSTAGYGDVVPRTAFGKILSVPLLLFGLLLIALPSFVLGRNFAIVYDAMLSIVGQPGRATPIDGLSDDEEAPNKPLAPVNENSTTPLLPLSVNTNESRSHSPNPFGDSITPPTQKMWAGNPSLHTPIGPIGAAPAGPSGGQTPVRDNKDLSNTKLAKNQYVLLEQIESLRRTVEQQGEMLSTLMQALAPKEGVDLSASSSEKKDKGKAKAKEEKHEEKHDAFDDEWS